MWGSHAPMVSAARRFLRFGKRAAHHYSICAASERFANVTASAHPAIRDDRNVARRFFEMSIARRGAIDGCGHLRDTEPEHTAGSTSRSRPNTDQNRSRTALHDLEGHVVTNRVSDDHGNAHPAAKFLQIERFILRRNMPDGRDGALHNEYVRPCFLRDLADFSRPLGNGAYRSQCPAVFDLAHACGD